MSDERIGERIHDAFDREYGPVEPGLAGRVLSRTFDPGAAEPAARRRFPNLAVAAAIVLAVVTVTVMELAGGRLGGHAPTPRATPVPATQPSPTPTPVPQAIIYAAKALGPLLRVDWNGQPLSTVPDEPSPRGNGISVAPDGSRYVVVGPQQLLRVVNMDGSVVDITLTGQTSTPLVKWADDSAHLCVLSANALVYASATGGSVSLRLRGPGLPASESAMRLVACSAARGIAVIAVVDTSCSGKGCATVVDLLDLHTGSVRQALANPAPSSFGSPLASLDGRYFAEMDYIGQKSMIWDLDTGALVARLDSIVLVFSGDDSLVGTQTSYESKTNNGHLIDWRTGHEVWSAAGESPVLARPGGRDIACFPDGGQHHILIVHGDGTTVSIATDAYPQLYP